VFRNLVFCRRGTLDHSRVPRMLLLRPGKVPNEVEARRSACELSCLDEEATAMGEGVGQKFEASKVVGPLGASGWSWSNALSALFEGSS
jgi:hypothetical protein